MKKEKVKNILIENKFAIICFIIGFIVSIFASLYRTFCDEPDIISASWLMAKGYHLYSDIFCHHMPIPYWFLEIFQLLHINNIVVLRIIFAIITQAYFIFLYCFFKKKTSKYVIPITSVIFALMRNIFLQNVILADSFVALGFLTIFLEIIANPKMNYNTKDKILISFATIISFGSSLIAVYPLAIFYIYYIIHRLILYVNEKQNIKKNFIEDLKFMIIVLLPFLLIALYFLLTNTMDDFIENAIKFNTDYYSIFNGKSTPVSLIINQFTKIPTWGLIRIKLGTIYLPLYAIKTTDVFVGVNVIVFIIWSILAVYKKRENAILLILFAFFCYMRDGFHASTFFILCNYFVAENIVLCFTKLKDKNAKPKIKTVIAIVIIFVYTLIYIGLLLIDNYKMIQNKEYVSDYGKDYKEIILSVTNDEDKIWAAPLYAELYFVTQREPANENIFYLPWQSIKPGVNEKLIEDLESNKTKVIIYDSEREAFGIKASLYSEALEKYLNENYFVIDGLSTVFFRNENKEEIINKLLEKEIIRREENGEIVFCNASI